MKQAVIASLFMLLLASGTAGAEPWNILTVQDNPSATEIVIYYDMQFVNAQKGFAVGANGLTGGAIFATEDGGMTWRVQHQMPLFQTLNSVSFVDETTGWAVGYNGLSKTVNYILHTNDGGVTWTAQTSGINVGLYGVHFINATTGWAAGSGPNIIKTTDGGATWTKQTVPAELSFYNIYFADENNGWAVGSGLASTSDGGATWVDRGHHSAKFWGVHLIDAATGWFVGGGGTIYRTADGGTTLIYQSVDGFEDFKDVHFFDSQTGIVVGGRSGGSVGVAALTTDGGATWTRQDIGTERDLECLCFLNNTIGWAGGRYGIVLQTTDRAGTGVGREDGPAVFTLEQNTPNPFNPSTSITFELPRSEHVLLEVFNLSGQRITTLADWALAPGPHTFIWNGTSMNGSQAAAGLYVYRLSAGASSQARKMLLIR